MKRDRRKTHAMTMETTMKHLPLVFIILASTCFAAPPSLQLQGSEPPGAQGTLLWISNAQSREVLALLPDGSIRWNGRKVKTDKEFRAAMIAMAKTLQDGACRRQK